MRDGEYIPVLIGLLVLVVPMLIAEARILSKAEESGWKILIPFYGTYCLFRIGDWDGIFVGRTALSIIGSLIIEIVFEDESRMWLIGFTVVFIILTIHWIFSVALAEAFGKEKDFAFGLFLLHPIFIMILGFGSAEYQGWYTTSPQRTWTCSTCGTENPVYKGICPVCGAQKQRDMEYTDGKTGS